MNRLPEFNPIIQSLTEAKSAAIFLPENPPLDIAAAALSLYLSLQKTGKEVSIVCSSPMTVRFSQLVGINKVSSKISGRSLVISFDYSDNAIDKVSYNIENKKFNLVVQPKPGSTPLSTKNVSYTHSGDLKLGIVIGSVSLDKLGPIYQQEKEIFNQTQIINIDIHPNNSRFGKVNAIFPKASSFSEIIAALLKAANYPLDRDIAGNLLLGIQEATTNFGSPRTTAQAFEAAAFCLRSGAQRRSVARQTQGKPSQEAPSLPLRTMTKTDSAARTPQVPQPKGKNQGETDSLASQQTRKKPAPDWYGPKIYRGSKRV